MRWWCFGQALPPHITIIGQCHIGKDNVLVKRIDAIGICFEIGAWRNTKVTGLWIDCVKTRFAGRSVFARLNPGDVVTNGSHFPAFKSFGRNHHGEIGFATRRGECGCDVVFLSLW